MTSTRLDPACWQSRPGFARLIAAFPAGSIRLVGGAVRDWLLDAPVADIDLATTLAPDQVIACLHTAAIKAVPTGLAHGTVTAVVAGAPHEVTTLRRDVATFGRHAEVAFTDDWRQDAARRDFTINALYADPESGAVSDWFGGLADLAARHVRFIGDPLTRIGEDHLRILRFFRFSARFGGALDAPGLAACRARARDLMTLSRERIRDELLKILALPDPAATLGVMIDQGILAPVLPELTDIAALARLIAAETAAGVAPHPVRRLAALTPADPDVSSDLASDLANDLSGRLRLSRIERARLVAAADRTPVPADPRALAYRLGGATTLDRLLLTNDPRAAQWAGPLAAWQAPRLPISGKDLIAMGLPPGPAVSRALRAVETQWIAAGFPPGRAEVNAIARAVLARR